MDPEEVEEAPVGSETGDGEKVDPVLGDPLADDDGAGAADPIIYTLGDPAEGGSRDGETGGQDEVLEEPTDGDAGETPSDDGGIIYTMRGSHGGTVTLHPSAIGLELLAHGYGPQHGGLRGNFDSVFGPGASHGVAAAIHDLLGILLNASNAAPSQAATAEVPEPDLSEIFDGGSTADIAAAVMASGHHGFAHHLWALADFN